MRTWPVRLLVLLLVGCGIFTLGTFVRFRLEERPRRGPFEMNAVLLDLLGDRVSEYLAEGRTDKLDALLGTLRERGVRVVVHDAGLQPLADNGPVMPVPFGPPPFPDERDGTKPRAVAAGGTGPAGPLPGLPMGPPPQLSWSERILGALEGRIPPGPPPTEPPREPVWQSPETEAAIQAEAREQAEDARDTGATQLDFPQPFTLRPAVLMADPIDLPGGAHGVLTLRKDMPTPPDMRLPPFVLPLAVAMVLAGGVLHLLLRQASRPIGEVGSALQRFARGDLQARVTGDVATHGTELARLARDFNTMAARTEELLQTQRRLLHDVSHEMRSPLSRVSLALEMASRTVSPESQRFLERIRRDAERLSTLSAHLLATGHLDQQKEEAPPAWFDLQAMLTQLADETDFQARADAKRVELRVNTPCAAFHGMREMLYGALDNVVQNALKFSPPDTQVTVTLSCVADRAEPSGTPVGACRDTCRKTCDASRGAGADNGSGPERQVVISVRDQGPGVPEADLPMLFVPFFRAGNAPRGTGTGLGLAIAQRAVELHGGTIAAENLPTGGLQVTIRLPA
ncbi:sensor histidine kinase [Nitratidesulfovibrio sp. SRB-5]|uniref:sensor histidine kinase n=1 Tax=Nitratidesulfovibrio sp. SRB-5 TaxID=2872636 RepID=UPI00102861A3|nr:HAMP domain-containing sensor histidine kinase [Nitratidesulfovibrio sp. SRB-5]MBZ2172219.1 HAMP domain-containing histidine kinase [Nitratidesulfovibrio sp. SRB-5]RXF76096.1 HAMP domain-containing histidine kinase [Desulfovibrio sp. DS-1]